LLNGLVKELTGDAAGGAALFTYGGALVTSMQLREDCLAQGIDPWRCSGRATVGVVTTVTGATIGAVGAAQLCGLLGFETGGAACVVGGIVVGAALANFLGDNVAKPAGDFLGGLGH
jgi:hypothetical protein